MRIGTRFNQQLAPGDWVDNGTYWERLIVFKADNTTASVKLWNTNADGTTVANAARIIGRLDFAEDLQLGRQRREHGRSAQRPTITRYDLGGRVTPAHHRRRRRDLTAETLLR